MPDRDGRPLHISDRVTWAGSGWCSALIGGPGKVVALLENDYCQVKVLTAGECLGNRFRAGEVITFRQTNLRYTGEK